MLRQMTIAEYHELLRYLNLKSIRKKKSKQMINDIKMAEFMKTKMRKQNHA